MAPAGCQGVGTPKEQRFSADAGASTEPVGLTRFRTSRKVLPAGIGLGTALGVDNDDDELPSNG